MQYCHLSLQLRQVLTAAWEPKRQTQRVSLQLQTKKDAIKVTLMWISNLRECDGRGVRVRGLMLFYFRVDMFGIRSASRDRAVGWVEGEVGQTLTTCAPYPWYDTKPKAGSRKWMQLEWAWGNDIRVFHPITFCSNQWHWLHPYFSLSIFQSIRLYSIQDFFFTSYSLIVE